MSNVRDFGASGDGKADDTNAVLHALQQGDGVIEFPRGEYRLTRTISLPLDQLGPMAIVGSGGTACVLMAGAGPAFHFIGTHAGTADPESAKPNIWQKQRLPTVLNLEIEGRHPDASGFLLEGTMQPTFEGILLRRLVTGIHLRQRNRNVLISHCHIYDLAEVGVLFDEVNLHQAIITGSHISYCKRAGIKIVGSEIRNLQITGNDIEYNYDVSKEESADIWIDSRGDRASVREGTIVGNTIQAKYSPGGANIRMLGHNATNNHKAGMFTISDNLIGSQHVNVHLSACRGVVVNGNVIYSGHRRNLLVEGSRNIVIGPNSFDHNPDYGVRELCTGVRIEDSNDVTLTGVLLHDCQTGENTVTGAVPVQRDGLLEVVRTRRLIASGCEVLDGTPAGIYLEDCDDVNVSGCTVLDSRPEKRMQAAIRWKGTGAGNMLTGCRLGRGTTDAIAVEPTVRLLTASNLIE